MNHQCNKDFYKLLRLSLGLTQEFPVEVDADGWRRLYQTAIRQSLVGVCYKGVCLLPEGSKPPAEIAMQWASEAESIKGMNELLYQEAVVVGTGAWVRGCYNSNMWLKYYDKMTDDDKNMLPLKRISFLGNNE